MASGYGAVYSSSEISEPVVDLIISIVAALVGFGSLIALILLYGYVKNKGVRFG